METIKVQKQKLIYDIRNLCTYLGKEFNKEEMQATSYGDLIQYRADLHYEKYKSLDNDQRVVSDILDNRAKFIAPNEFRDFDWTPLVNWQVRFIELRTGKTLEENLYTDGDGKKFYSYILNTNNG
jgi:hypothetical protein